MWHVDEGALHAYLDGALDEYPAAEARRVREHLETCADCTHRLAAERDVRDRAEDILDLAAPRVEAPTFEELRAYVKAQAPQRSRVSVRLYRLSWAASVVLALGTGWLLRGEAPASGLSPAEGAFASDVAEEAAAAAPVAATTSSSELERPSELQADVADAAEARGGSLSGSQQLLDASGGDGFADAARSARQAPEPEPFRPESSERLDEVMADGAAVRAESTAQVGAARERDAATSPADDSAADTAPVTTPALVREPAQAAASRVVEQRLTSAIRPLPVGGLVAGAPTPGRTSASDPASADVATVSAESESVSLVVPGLEVLDVLPVGEGTTFAGVRALQRLPTGDTLETAHLPAGVDARALPPLPVGWSEVIRARGSGWLIMRGPLDEASLTELLQRLEGGR